MAEHIQYQWRKYLSEKEFDFRPAMLLLLLLLYRRAPPFIVEAQV